MATPRPRRERLLAGAAVLITTLLVVGTVAPSTGPGFEPRGDAVDLGALAEVLALLDAGARGSWLVRYDLTRRVGDASSTGAYVEANRPSQHVSGGADALTLRFGDRTAVCSRTAGGSSCVESTGDDGAGVPAVAVVAALVRDGRYRLRAVAGRTVAGERARCFAFRHRHGPPVEALGDESEHCFAPDGVPLASRVSRPGVTAVRAAVVVHRPVTTAELEALLDPFDAADAAPSTGSDAVVLGSIRG